MRTYNFTFKGLALFLAVLMALTVFPASAFAAEDGTSDTLETSGDGAPEYVLMNIPYDKFYAAEIDNDIPVDAVSSATRNKPRTGTLVNGSYHVNADGSDISGVTFPVKVGDGADLSGYTQITDDNSVEITVTNRGQTTTTTYSGKDALFESEDYSYYVLEEEPAYYKILEADGSFSKVKGAESQTIDADVELTTVSSYGDYQITIESESLDTSKVYGVALTTTDGSGYGLRHLENIWQGKKLAFCTGFTTSVHNCPTDSNHYASIMGKTIEQITYYTESGIYEIAVDLPVPEKSYQIIPAIVDGVEKQITVLQTEDGSTVSYDFSKLDLSDTGTFPNGDMDAYLVTAGGETELAGDKTLSRWVGTWESWETYLDPSGTAGIQYPYLNQVWQLAYQAYMAAFQSAGIDMSAAMPDVAALQAYWKKIATTKGVETIEIAPGGRGSYTIKWRDASGTELGSGNYVMTGKLLKGFEGAPAYVFTAQNEDVNSSYKYLIAMEPGMDGTETEPIAKHYHFQFGSSLEDMLLEDELYNSTDYGTNEATGRPVSSNLKNSQWYATVIDAESTALAKYNVILGMHQANKWSSLPNTGGSSSGDSSGGSSVSTSRPSASRPKASDHSDNNKQSSDTAPENSTPSPNPAAPVDTTPSGFADVLSGMYYTDAVEWAAARGITSGVSSTIFSPDSSCTRGQVVAFLWRAMGEPSGAGQRFTDVSEDAYYADAVSWAVGAGVTVGKGNHEFAPEAPVTRAQFVTFLYRAAGSPDVSGNCAFTDVAPDAYYYNAVLWAAQQGIASGTSTNSFSPDALCSRGQIVTFLYRFMGD